MLPRFFTFVVNKSEADKLNEVVQVYSSKMIFYRSERPDIAPHFQAGQHGRYKQGNPVEQIIDQIPGIERATHIEKLLSHVATPLIRARLMQD